jgi:flagellum-specific peptidoglycan hydrolase FlgJ
LKPTTEYVNGVPVSVTARFRAYPDTLSGFQDRVNFLKRFSRYSNAGVFTAATPEQQARALQTAGYATDPEYSNLLIKLINQNNLKQYDHA